MSHPFDHTPVIPVVTIGRAEDALPLAEALLAGGLDICEVTLRTPQALRAIEAIAKGQPDMRVGAATVLRPADITSAKNAGAKFLVSPGLTEDLASSGIASGLPFIPGATTASEIMAAWERHFSLLMFFPALGSGGVEALASLAPVFKDIMFCPVVGVSESDAAQYLALPNVPAVAATWIAPEAAIAERDWAGITARARRALALRGG